MKKKVIVLFIIISAVTIFTVIIKNKPNYSGTILRVAGSITLTDSSFSDGVAAFEEKYNCTVEYTDNFSQCDLFYSPGDDFSEFLPLDNYINPNSSLYSKNIIRQSCKSDGKIYGITHVLLGNLNYCRYDPTQFSGNLSPYDYFKNGNWTWDSFIKMADYIHSNIAVNWHEPYINMMYSLSADENGKTIFDYNSRNQVEWLNFVRTLIYDEGISDNFEGAFKVDFLPSLVLDSVESDVQMRYIPWPTKNGGIGTMYIEEYHFCVPKHAKNPKLSVKLANSMIKSCKETRLALYRAGMTEEDFKIFKKQLKNSYSFPHHTDFVPAQTFIDDFTHGKTVTEHIYNVENGILHND